MESPNWLRLITVGLVLAAIALGYFLISNRFVSTKTTKTQKTTTQVVEETAQPSEVPGSVVVQPSVVPSSSPTSSPRATAKPTNPPAYTQIADRAAKGGLQTLPKTGAPLFFIGVGSLSAIIAGLGLRKFPH